MIYHGKALATLSASRPVAIVLGGLAFALLFNLFMLAWNLGLAGGN